MFEINDNLCWYIKDPSEVGEGPFPSTSMIHQYNQSRISPNTLVKHNYMSNWISFKDSILAAQKYVHLRKDSIHKANFNKKRVPVPRNTFVNYISTKVSTEIGNKEATTELTVCEIEKIKKNYSVFAIKLFLWLLGLLTVVLISTGAMITILVPSMLFLVLPAYYRLRQNEKRLQNGLQEALIQKHNKKVISIRETIKKSEEDKREERKRELLRKVEEESIRIQAQKNRIAREKEFQRRKEEKEARRANFYTRTEFDLGDSAHSIYILKADKAGLPIKFGITNNLDRRIREHRKSTNINYRLYKRFWLQNEKHAKVLEQALIKNLHGQNHPRVGNEFFNIPVGTIEQELYSTYEQLKFRGRVI